MQPRLVPILPQLHRSMVNDNNAAAPSPEHDAPASRIVPGVALAELSRRILIVDDDPDMRDLLSLVLSGAGYRVACAEDGELGWDALCASSYDAMISDHDMPRLTGLDLLRRVRAGPLRLPVILISGDMPWHEPDLERLLPPGVAIDKPFLLDELLVSVRNVFGWPRYADHEPKNDGALACVPSRPPGADGLIS